VAKAWPGPTPENKDYVHPVHDDTGRPEHSHYDQGTGTGDPLMTEEYKDTSANYGTGIEGRQQDALDAQALLNPPQAEKAETSPLQQGYDSIQQWHKDVDDYRAKPSDSID
jgi:hypothetical protein